MFSEWNTCVFSRCFYCETPGSHTCWVESSQPWQGGRMRGNKVWILHIKRRIIVIVNHVTFLRHPFTSYLNPKMFFKVDYKWHHRTYVVTLGSALLTLNCFSYKATFLNSFTLIKPCLIRLLLIPDGFYVSLNDRAEVWRRKSLLIEAQFFFYQHASIPC